MTVRLTHEIELVAGDQLQVVHLDKETIVLNSLHTDHYEMILAGVDDLRVDDVLALWLTLISNLTRHTGFKIVILLPLLGTMDTVLAKRETV